MLPSTDGLYERARRRIPGGTQLLSKRPERFLPGGWPAYYEKARGIDVWGLDGRRYQDFASMGLGACVLGYADPKVDDAVLAAVRAGNMATLNCREELDLAERLCQLHPWADAVRLARTGGEAMAVAVRLARASTGKDVVAFCGYHGWSDWYLAANLADDSALDGHLLPGLDPAGVPRCLKGSAVPFTYNRIDELEAVVDRVGAKLGAIVMEPVRNREPADGFLGKVRAVASKIGVPLIFDEVSSGFRLADGGAHLALGVEPDVAVFAKALGNGYPIAAVIGRDEVMDAARSSFVSSTNWSDRIGPSAALAMIDRFVETTAHDRLRSTGRRVQEGWREAARETDLPVQVDGIEPLAHFSFGIEDAEAAHTLFTQEMLGQGYLASTSFYASTAHQAEDVQAYLGAVRDAFGKVRNAIDAGNLRAALRGPVREAGFTRLT